MKLKDTLGVTSYLWYGGGSGHGNITSVDKFKFQRFFVDNFAVTKGTLELKVEPTHQNFKYDTYLRTLKNAGIRTMWATAGVFDWIPMPINPKTGEAYSRRKSMSYDPTKDPTKPETWDEFAELCRQIVTYYNGKDLLDILEIGNEWNFKWNVPHVITEEEYAVCLKRVFDVCLPINSTVKIAMGGGISPSLSQFERIITKLKELYALEGKGMPKNWYLNFHWYMRNGSSDQGNGTSGITPEDANAYQFGKDIDAIVDREGLLGWFCTETGWATDNSKQHTPDGMDRYLGQGWLMVRLSLIWGATKHCKGISFWHCRDLYDAQPYAYGGINNKDWSAKPGRTVCEEYLAKYGDLEISNFRKEGEVYKVNVGDKTLSWGNISSPNPVEGDIAIDVPPPTPTNMKVYFSTKSDRSDAIEFTDITAINPGSYYVEAKEVTAPVQFTLSKDGVVVKSQKENGAPFDLAGGQPFSFTQGAYSLKVQDKTFTINVGSVTPPPETTDKVVDITITNPEGVVVKVNGTVI